MLVRIFDTETTGIPKNRKIPLNKLPEIIEFYGCEVDLSTGEVVRELDILIKPTVAKNISQEITKITGIDWEMVKDKPNFEESWMEIFEFLSGDSPLIAHNISFDKDMIEIEAERLGYEINWPRLICTVEQTMHLKGYRLKLSALYELLFNQKMKEAHRAKVDVNYLKACCVKLHQTGAIQL